MWFCQIVVILLKNLATYLLRNVLARILARYVYLAVILVGTLATSRKILTISRYFTSRACYLLHPSKIYQQSTSV